MLAFPVTTFRTDFPNNLGDNKVCKKFDGGVGVDVERGDVGRNKS